MIKVKIYLLFVFVLSVFYPAGIRRSPVGLPVPEILAKDKKTRWSEETVRVLQETAWEAVTQNPLSGVINPDVGMPAQEKM